MWVIVCCFRGGDLCWIVDWSIRVEKGGKGFSFEMMNQGNLGRCCCCWWYNRANLSNARGNDWYSYIIRGAEVYEGLLWMFQLSEMFVSSNHQKFVFWLADQMKYYEGEVGSHFLFFFSFWKKGDIGSKLASTSIQQEGIGTQTMTEGVWKEYFLGVYLQSSTWKDQLMWCHRVVLLFPI